MRLLGRNKAPQRLRASIEEQGGVVQMRLSAILRPLGFNSPTPLALASAQHVLDGAGVIADPPIEQSSWDDIVTVSLAPAGSPAQASPSAPPVVEPAAVEEPPAEEPPVEEAPVDEAPVEAPAAEAPPVAEPPAAEVVADEA